MIDRVIGDGKVVLGMIALAALVYYAVYNFALNFDKPRPPRTRISLTKSLVMLVLGFGTALLLVGVLHVQPLWLIAIALIGSVVSSFIERKRARPVT
ncbi:MAG TPA: hypothetical protein VEJ41_04225 [Candidatus Acidoferrales bacterium]|nr:hypothetical protein [Candidatus Acidoferrales bacterium]